MTTITIRYWDATTDRMVEYEGRVIRSGAGYGPGPSYGVLYRLSDGRYLGGMRHTDRGNLMTDVRIGPTRAEALPQSARCRARKYGW